MSILGAVAVFAGIFLMVFIFGAPATYDAQAEEEDPK